MNSCAQLEQWWSWTRRIFLQWRDTWPVYRSRRGWVLGVCRGAADYAELPVLWIRVVFAVTLLLTGFFPFGLVYVLAGVVLKPEPLGPRDPGEDWSEFRAYVISRTTDLNRIQRRYADLEHRMRRTEARAAARQSDWDERFRSGE